MSGPGLLRRQTVIGATAAMAVLVGGLVTTTVIASAATAGAVVGYHVVSGTGAINARSGPGVQYAILGTLKDGQAIDITCQTRGSLVGVGMSGTPTDVWDKLANGWYVTDYYTSTPGLAGGWTTGIPNCTPVAPTPVPTPAPVPRPAEGCADLQVLAARGSGEPATPGGGLGSVVAPFVASVKAALPKANVAVWAAPNAPASIMPVTSRSAATLRKSIDAAATQLRTQVDRHLAGCPDEHLLLVGYGAGAGAAHRTWDALMTGTGVDRHRGRLDGVVLFADPLFDPRQRTPKAATTLGVGTFDTRRPGLLGPEPLVWSPKLAAVFWMKSYCAKGDVLCNTDLLHTSAGTVAYTSYASKGVATRAGTEAGRWFAGRYFGSIVSTRSR